MAQLFIIMLSVIMLSVIMLSVIMLNVVLLIVVAPTKVEHLMLPHFKGTILLYSQIVDLPGKKISLDKPGNTNLGGRLSTVDLLIKVTFL